MDKWNRSIFNGHLLSTDLTELPAAYNGFYRGAEPVVLGLQLVLHFRQQRTVRKHHSAAEGITEQLAAELSQDDGPFLVEQIIAQSLGVIHRRAVEDFCPRFNWPAAEVLGTQPAYGIASLKRETVAIDVDVTARAAGVAA